MKNSVRFHIGHTNKKLTLIISPSLETFMTLFLSTYFIFFTFFRKQIQFNNFAETSANEITAWKKKNQFQNKHSSHTVKNKNNLYLFNIDQQDTQRYNNERSRGLLQTS